MPSLDDVLDGQNDKPSNLVAQHSGSLGLDLNVDQKNQDFFGNVLVIKGTFVPNLVAI